MIYDPNSTIPHSHEVRVTMRGVRLSDGGTPVQVSTRSDFIAPDLSAPSTLAIELDKGKRGWSDYDVKVPAPAETRADVVNREALDYTCGTPIARTTKSTGNRVYRPASSRGAAHRARQAAVQARFGSKF